MILQTAVAQNDSVFTEVAQLSFELAVAMAQQQLQLTEVCLYFIAGFLGGFLALFYAPGFPMIFYMTVSFLRSAAVRVRKD